MSKQIHTTKKEESEVLDRLLLDRTAAKQTDFVAISAKDGVSSGYVGDRIKDSKRHILKGALKKISRDLYDLSTYPGYLTYTRNYHDRLDFITEYINSRIYERLLPNRSPVISIASGEGADQDKVYLTSKFFDGFQTLAQYTQRPYGELDPSHPRLRNIRGFEKVIAACTFAGETDYHPNNIGVVPSLSKDGSVERDEMGNHLFQVVKIDHGKSLMVFESESHMRQDLFSKLIRYQYNTFKFNLEKYREAMEANLQMTDDEIDKFTSKSIRDASVAGLEIQGMASAEDGMSAEERLSKSFADSIKQRRDQAKALVTTLKILEKIDEVTQGWKDGGWIIEVNHHNPILWAHYNSKKIDGKPAIEWAYENGGMVTYDPGLNPLIHDYEQRWILSNKDQVLEFARKKEPSITDPGEIINYFKNHRNEFFEEKRSEETRISRESLQSEARTSEIKRSESRDSMLKAEALRLSLQSTDQPAISSTTSATGLRTRSPHTR